MTKAILEDSDTILSFQDVQCSNEEEHRVFGCRHNHARLLQRSSKHALTSFHSHGHTSNYMD